MQEEEFDSVAEFRIMHRKGKEALDSLLEHLGDPDWVVFYGTSIPGRVLQPDGTYQRQGELHIGFSICHLCAPDKVPMMPTTWHDVQVETTISQFLCETHKAG